MKGILDVAQAKATHFGVKNILVPTAATGNTVKATLKFFGSDYELYAIGNPPASYTNGICLHRGINGEKRRELEALGIKVALQDYSVLMGKRFVAGGKDFDFSGKETPQNVPLSVIVENIQAGKDEAIMGIIYHAFLWFGEAGKVCLECAFMAADSGVLPLTQDCLVFTVTKTLQTPDVCMVLSPATTENLFTWNFGIHDVTQISKYVPLIVSDLGASLGFYRDILGLSPSRGNEDTEYVEFSVGSATLVLSTKAAMPDDAASSIMLYGEEPGSADLRIQVPDMQAVCDRAFVKSVPSEEDGITLRDPDGNRISLATFD